MPILRINRHCEFSWCSAILYFLKVRSSSEPMYSNGSVHSARTNWAPTVLVSRQPIMSWRLRTWPMNASCNWVDLLQVSSAQFMCCEQNHLAARVTCTCIALPVAIACHRVSWHTCKKLVRCSFCIRVVDWHINGTARCELSRQPQEKHFERFIRVVGWDTLVVNDAGGETVSIAMLEGAELAKKPSF